MAFHKKRQHVIFIIAVLLLQSIALNAAVYEGNTVVIEGYCGPFELSGFLQYVDAKGGGIVDKYADSRQGKVRIVLFDTVERFHAAGHGRKGNESSVGTGTNWKVYMVNPFCSSVHDYDEMCKIAVHELTHAVTMHGGIDVPIWLSEGIAMLEADQGSDYSLILKRARKGDLPKFDDLKYDDNSVYAYSRSIAEYLESTYELSKVKELFEGKEPLKVLGKNSEELVAGWGSYIIDRYGNDPDYEAPRVEKALFPDGQNAMNGMNVRVSTSYIDLVFSQRMKTTGKLAFVSNRPGFNKMSRFRDDYIVGDWIDDRTLRLNITKPFPGGFKFVIELNYNNSPDLVNEKGIPLESTRICFTTE